jgi:hypothetical protein
LSTVKRAFKSWLVRVEATASAIHPAHLQAAKHQQSLRARARICEMIRERFILMGLDWMIAVSLRVGEEAAAELAAIPDTELLRSADLALTRSDLDDCVGVRRSFETKIQQMAARFYDGSQPKFANASVMELLAYCVAIENLACGHQDSLQTQSNFFEGEPVHARAW